MPVDEREISQQLLKLPRETRQHLVAAYSDAAALSGEMIKVADHQHLMHKLMRQQGMYVRIARALLESLLDDPVGNPHRAVDNDPCASGNLIERAGD